MTTSINNLIDVGMVAEEILDHPAGEVEITSRKKHQETVVIKMTARNKEEAKKILLLLKEKLGEGLLSVKIGE
jgi:hypothetical protein